MPTVLRRPRLDLYRTLRPSARRSLRVSVRAKGCARTFVIPKRAFDDLLEDMEALSSPKFLASIRRARRDVARGRTYTLEQVKRELDIR